MGKSGSRGDDGVCFFFSSRRRHTRLQGDWSSDVCSSDLYVGALRSEGLGGILAEALAAEGADVTGVDPSEKSLGAAREHAKRSGLSISYRLATAENLASCNFPDPFDLVFAVDVLEHVDDLDRALAAIAVVLAPGGGLGFLTHNRTIAAFLQVIWDEEYVHHTMPEGLHDFARFITPGELTDGLQRNGMVVQEMKGIARAEDGTGRRVLTDDLTVTYLGWALRTR